MVISGTTKIIFMVGNPIDQVKSPAIMNKIFVEMAVDIAVIPIAVQPDGIDDFMKSFRHMNNALGAIYTVPFKQKAFAECDSVSTRAQLLEVCNVVRKDKNGTLWGDATDGLGYLAGLENHNMDPSGKVATVIGAGGAGAAIACGLAERKAHKILILDVNLARQEELLNRLAGAFPDTIFLRQADEGFAPDIIANATPLGMRPNDPLPFPADQLPPFSFVSDVVTNMAMTPFLQAAKQRNCIIQTGAEMAAAQVELFANFIGTPFK